MTISTPPDQTVWWDEAEVTAAALDVLRLTDADIDADRIAALVSAAGAAINNELDRPADDPVAPPATPLVDGVAYVTLEHDLADTTGITPTASFAPAPLQFAIVQVVVEMYRNKDAPPSSLDGMLAGSWRPQSFDPLAGIRSLITPYKSRWGVA